jgi:membrane protein required for colicin V production
MTGVDIVLSVILLACFVFGFLKGIIASVIHLLGLISSLVLIVRFAPLVQDGLILRFQMNTLVAGILSYSLIFIMIMLLAKIIILLLHKLVSLLNLTFINRFLGAIFGLLNGFILLTIIFTVIEFLPFYDEVKKATKDSYIVKYLQIASDEIKLEIIQRIPQPEVELDKIKNPFKK